MRDHLAPQDQPEANIEVEGLPPLMRAPTAPARNQLDPHDGEVNIPLVDVVQAAPEVNQVAAQLKPEVQERVNAILRQGPELLGPQATREEVQAYNERVKRDFTEQVMEARHRAAAPPPPPQPTPRAIAEQTKKEMAAGAKQSAYWAEQQKLRPPPSARDIQAAGVNTPVFQPASYTYEKGEGFKGKDYTRTDLPNR